MSDLYLHEGMDRSHSYSQNGLPKEIIGSGQVGVKKNDLIILRSNLQYIRVVIYEAVRSENRLFQKNF